MEKIDELISEYLEQYPDAENPLSFWEALGEDKLIQILEARQGKRIIFVEEDGEDQVNYSYA